MPPPRPAPGTAREWLDRPHGKLALASVHDPLPPGAYWEDLCFLAQQAAELAIKAVYQVHGWLFPFIHDLGDLVEGLERQGLVIPQTFEKLIASALTPFWPGIQADYCQRPKTNSKTPAGSRKAWLPGRNPSSLDGEQSILN
jgi:HEPN domain-containing protein